MQHAIKHTPNQLFEKVTVRVLRFQVQLVSTRVTTLLENPEFTESRFNVELLP